MPTEPQIIDFYSKDISLSKMNKPDLYKKCQEVIRENMKLQMFNNMLEDENTQLINDLSACEDTNKKLKEQIEQYEKEFEELKDTEKSFEIIQNITGELVDKEDKIIELEKELEEANKMYKMCRDSNDINASILELEDDYEEHYFQIGWEGYAEHMDSKFVDIELFTRAMNYAWDIIEDKCLNEEEVKKVYQELREDNPHREDLLEELEDINDIIEILDNHYKIFEFDNELNGRERMWVICEEER